jgi:hypothetical protein
LHHVQSHQDRETPLDQLSPIAQLNITADELASTVYDSSSFDELVPMAPGVRAHLKTPIARLNITADELASTAYDSSTFDKLVPMAPGVRAHLKIIGKTLVSKYRSTSRDIQRTQNIKAWITSKKLIIGYICGRRVTL